MTTLTIEGDDALTLEELRRTGEHANLDEAVVYAIRSAASETRQRQRFDAAIAEARADIDAGRVHTLEEAFSYLEAKYAG